MIYYHLMNMRTPFDYPNQDALLAFGDYKLSLPIKADPLPGITPIPQAEMIVNGIVGLYVRSNAAETPDIAKHWPAGFDPTMLTQRPSIGASE